MQPCCWRQLNATAAALELAKTARDSGSADNGNVDGYVLGEYASLLRRKCPGLPMIVHAPLTQCILRRLCTFKSGACWWSMVVTNLVNKATQVVRQLDRSIKGVQKAFDFAKSFDDFQTCRRAMQPESDLWCQATGPDNGEVVDIEKDKK